MEEAKKFQENFDEAMDDDFNTADAIAAVFDLVKFANTNAGEGSSKAFVDALKKMIQDLCDILGLITEKKAELLDADIEALKGTVKALPTREQIDVPVDEMLIVELYSK